MNSQENQPKTQPEHVTELLPWYTKGTLRPEDRMAVDTHLHDCPACRQELQEVRETSQDIQAYFEGLPGPSDQIWEKIQAKTINPAPSQAILKKEKRGIEHYLRSLFAFRWAPAIAVGIILGQTLLLLLSRPIPDHGTTTGPLTGPFIERGPTVTPSQPIVIATIQLVFKKNCPEGDMRTIIRQLQGKIIDGPTTNGTYTVEVPAPDEAGLDQRLHELQRTNPLVLAAQRISE